MAETSRLTRWRHDIKNQLGIVLGFSEILLEDVNASHPMRADLDDIRTAARSAMALVDELEDVVVLAKCDDTAQRE